MSAPPTSSKLERLRRNPSYAVNPLVGLRSFARRASVLPQYGPALPPTSSHNSNFSSNNTSNSATTFSASAMVATSSVSAAATPSASFGPRSRLSNASAELSDRDDDDDDADNESNSDNMYARASANASYDIPMTGSVDAPQHVSKRSRLAPAAIPVTANKANNSHIARNRFDVQLAPFCERCGRNMANNNANTELNANSVSMAANTSARGGISSLSEVCLCLPLNATASWCYRGNKSGHGIDTGSVDNGAGAAISRRKSKSSNRDAPGGDEADAFSNAPTLTSYSCDTTQLAMDDSDISKASGQATESSNGSETSTVSLTCTFFSNYYV